MIESILSTFGISGLILLFFWVFGGSLGIPGSTITIITFGSLTSSLSGLILIILICFIAAVLGDIFAYELARKISDPLRNKLRKLKFFRNNESKTKFLLNKYEFPIIFFTRFLIIGLCVAVSYISGLEKIKRRKFYFAVIPGEFLFAVIYSSIGYAAGGIIANLLTAINDFILVIILLILAFFAIRFIIKHNKRKRKLK
jgi:membrane protein DedA with SNARE-associated domain